MNNQQLRSAAQRGNLALVRQALQNGADVNGADLGWTPLHYACWKGHLEVARFLLDSGATLHAIDKKDRTPLHHACRYGHLEVARFLLDSGATLHAHNNYGDTPFHDACAFGHLDVIQYLVTSCDADLKATNNYGATPLSNACAGGHLDVVRYLVTSCDADLTATSSNGRTPFHCACALGHLDVIRYLVTSHDANVNETAGDSGLAPLHFACYPGSGHADAVRYLLNAGADPLSRCNQFGCLPLHLACYHGHMEAVRVLVDNPYSFFVKNTDDETPLDEAKNQGHAPIVDLLIYRYEKTVVEQQGRCFLHSVLRGANYSTNASGTGGVKVLLPIGTLDLEQMLNLLASLIHRSPALLQTFDDENGDTPLHIACETRAPVEVVRPLLEIGGAGMLQQRDANGALPIHAACRAGASIEVILFCIDSGGVQTFLTLDGNGSLPLHLFCGSGPSVQAVRSLERLYPRFLSIRTLSGDWPVLTAARDGSSSSLDVIYQLLRSKPDVVDAAVAEL